MINLIEYSSVFLIIIRILLKININDLESELIVWGFKLKWLMAGITYL